MIGLKKPKRGEDIIKVSILGNRAFCNYKDIKDYIKNYKNHPTSSEQNRRKYVLPVVGMGPLWPRIEHGHSGITTHLDTATFNACETLNLGV